MKRKREGKETVHMMIKAAQAGMTIKVGRFVKRIPKYLKVNVILSTKFMYTGILQIPKYLKVSAVVST